MKGKIYIINQGLNIMKNTNKGELKILKYMKNQMKSEMRDTISRMKIL